jgi:predicted RNase H-like HicB family nuclease
MAQSFTASITREGEWFVAQCLQVDVASQRKTEEDALANLGEALELHFSEPTAAKTPESGPSRSNSVRPRPLPDREV